MKKILFHSLNKFHILRQTDEYPVYTTRCSYQTLTYLHIQNTLTKLPKPRI